MKILYGKPAATYLENKLKDVIKTKGSKSLVIFQVGNIEASNKYIAMKVKKAESLNIHTHVVKVNDKVSNEELEQIIKTESVNASGCILQLPISDHLDKQKMLDAIPLEKDVDGLATGNNLIDPATPRGIVEMLNYYNIEIQGKIVGVVGQSNLVGKPIANILKVKAKEVRRFNIATGIKGTEECDILIVAVGSANLIKADNIKNDSVLIDVGINTLGNSKIVGDIDFESVKNKASAISPVPGGVGPMTVISLMANLIEKTK